MRIGELDKRIILQSPNQARDGMGQMTLTWTDVATVWAKKIPLSAREVVAALGTVAERSVKFRIRARTDVTERWRVSHNGVGYDVQGVQSFGAKDEMTELVCLEGLKDGR